MSGCASASTYPNASKKDIFVSNTGGGMGWKVKREVGEVKVP